MFSSSGTLRSTWSRWCCCCRWSGTIYSSLRGRIPGKMWWVTPSLCDIPPPHSHCTLNTALLWTMHCFILSPWQKIVKPIITFPFQNSVHMRSTMDCWRNAECWNGININCTCVAAQTEYYNLRPQWLSVGYFCSIHIHLSMTPKQTGVIIGNIILQNIWKNIYQTNKILWYTLSVKPFKRGSEYLPVLLVISLSRIAFSIWSHTLLPMPHTKTWSYNGCHLELCYATYLLVYLFISFIFYLLFQLNNVKAMSWRNRLVLIIGGHIYTEGR